MNHTNAMEFSRSGSSAPDLEAQPILEFSHINNLGPLPRIWVDGASDSAILRMAGQKQALDLNSRSDWLMPLLRGGELRPCGARSVPPVRRAEARLRSGRATPALRTDDDERGAQPATRKVEQWQRRPYPKPAACRPSRSSSSSIRSSSLSTSARPQAERCGHEMA
jgi:hypothetical protein